jgi:hypothetical protein
VNLVVSYESHNDVHRVQYKRQPFALCAQCKVFRQEQELEKMRMRSCCFSVVPLSHLVLILVFNIRGGFNV